mgnify:CR=1 FL=1
MKKSTKNIISVIVLIILLIILIYFVADYQRKKAVTPEPGEGEGLVKSPLGEFKPEEPRLTAPLERIPSGAVSIKASRGKFDPNNFTVKSGEVVSLVLTGTDGTHSLVFEDKSLEKIKIYVGKEESRGISFVAPKPGIYNFYCNIPGHKGAGETGVMHVQ